MCDSVMKFEHLRKVHNNYSLSIFYWYDVVCLFERITYPFSTDMMWYVHFYSFSMSCSFQLFSHAFFVASLWHLDVYSQSVAEIAEDIWDRYGYDFGTDYSGLFKALSHGNYNVRLSASEALAAILDEYPDTIQVFQLKIQLLVNF